MLIPFGKMQSFERLGRVGVPCPICRDFRAARLARVRDAWHVYFVPLVKTGEAGLEWTCETCGVIGDAPPEAFSGVHTDGPISVDDLVSKTLSYEPEQFDGWFELQSRVARNELGADERRALLREPFAYFALAVARRAGRVHIDRTSAIGLGLCAVLLASGITLASLHPKGGPLSIAGATGVLVGIVSALVFIGTDFNRYMRRCVYPGLARALVGMRPSPAEIKELVRELRREKNPTAKHAQWRRLARAVDRAGRSAQLP